MAEILNLDDLSNIVKQFQYKGRVYDVCEISLGDFIAMTAEQKEMEAKSKNGDITESDLIESYRRNIKRMIPEITDEALDSMTVRQLKVLLDFINSAAIDEKAVDEAKK